jgi:cell division protein FtsW (lipid II flippase)
MDKEIWIKYLIFILVAVMFLIELFKWEVSYWEIVIKVVVLIFVFIIIVIERRRKGYREA